MVTYFVVMEMEMGSVTILFIILPTDYNELVQIPLTPGELETARHSVNKGKPFGEDGWTDDMIRIYKLNITTRERGRPKKGI